MPSIKLCSHLGGQRTERNQRRERRHWHPRRPSKDLGPMGPGKRKEGGKKGGKDTGGELGPLSLLGGLVHEEKHC